jgi:hypothetical protein
MRTKGAVSILANESAHMAAVKALPCSVCAKSGPSEAHHIKQGLHFTVVALCFECHRGADGVHGTRARWRLYKADEIRALNNTIALLAAGGLIVPAAERQQRAPRRQQTRPSKGRTASPSKIIPHSGKPG